MKTLLFYALALVALSAAIYGMYHLQTVVTERVENCLRKGGQMIEITNGRSICAKVEIL